MLDTAPLPLANPLLAQQPVAVLLQHFTTALPWLSDAYGLVQTGTLKDNKNRVPQLYRQDGSLHSLDLMPDEKMQALSFFERNGASTLEWDDEMHYSGYWTHNLAAVVWLNLRLLDTRPDDFTEELALDFLTRGLLASPLGHNLTPSEIEQRSERIFSRYPGWPTKQQLLMYPFSGFRIQFTVRERYVNCPAPFVPAAGLLAPEQALGPQYAKAAVAVPIGSVLAIGGVKGFILYDATIASMPQSLYGMATTSAAAGGQVRVQSSGVVTIPGWGLKPGTTYLAGPKGKLVESDEGLVFSQILGRAVSADAFLYQPDDITILP